MYGVATNNSYGITSVSNLDIKSEKYLIFTTISNFITYCGCLTYGSKNTNFIKQVLITGCYRSGTEYFSLLLSNNKEIAVTMYTTSFMRYSFNKYNNIALKKIISLYLMKQNKE